MNRAFSLLLLTIASLSGIWFAACRGPEPTPAEVPQTWETVRDLPGHRAHVGKDLEDAGVKRAIACTDCHELGQENKLKSPGDKPCAKCHEKEDKSHHVGSDTTKTTCLTCHVFSVHDGKREAPTCAFCHSGPNGKLAHHATPEAPCTSCHTPHGEPKVVLASCTSCHQGIGANHGKMTVSAPDAGAGDAIAANDAHELHEGGLVAAPFVSADAAPAQVDRHATAAVCTTCHVPHKAAKDAREACIGCHVEHVKFEGPPALVALALDAPKVKPEGPKVAGHEACTTCHTPHDAKKESVHACLDCHAVKKPVTAVAGHAKCTGCHTPHAPTTAKSACATCHANHAAPLASTKVAAHADCASCHDVHTPTLKATTACAKCHEKVHPTHPTVTPAGVTPGDACIGCHTPHPGPLAGIARTCTSCHANKGTTDAAVHTGVACTKCHQPHAFDLKKRGPTLCAGCHTKQGAMTAKLKGHASCTSCHGAPHTPTKNVVCGTCHEKESTTAPKGHSTCTNCHSPHDGTFVRKPGAPATRFGLCTGCHEDKAKAQHANIPGSCGSCHRPHGPNGPASPPACLTCHDKTKLAGLHTSPSHSTCTSCHTSHAPPTPDRKTCTATCHEKQKNHKPEANLCSGCHFFKQK